MKSLSRNFAIALFFAFAIGSIYGCAEKPITFAGPGVQIWKLNVVWDDGNAMKDQTLVLKSSETEKDVFYVTATIDTETYSESWGKLRIYTKWEGEIRNSAMMCNIDGITSGIGGPSSMVSDIHGIAKGTFSKRRAAGTIQLKHRGFSMYGKWTAERIS
jgi:hypothetical protein